MKTSFDRIILGSFSAGVLALTSLAQSPSAVTPSTGASRADTQASSTNLGASGSETARGTSQANLEALFRKLDTNGDGNISREEFMKGSDALHHATSGSGIDNSGSSSGSAPGTRGSTTGTSGTGTSPTEPTNSGTGTSGKSGTPNR